MIVTSVKPSNAVTETVSPSCCFISTTELISMTVTSTHKSGGSIPLNESRKLLLQVVPGKNNLARTHVATI